ncbi:MAG: NADH-quinone oxidoreductase subunit NuoF [Candidatus Zixiibacteriota bacterium]|jgi:NADH-quinone oxidoreductase subunit F
MTISVKTPDELEAARAEILAGRGTDKTSISLCAGTGCSANGSPAVALAFISELEKNGLKDSIEFRATGCHGFCEQGPMVVIRPMNIFYRRVKPKDVPDIIEKTVRNGEIIERLLYRDPVTKEKIKAEDDIAFYRGQQRIVLSDNGFIDPRSLEDYLAVGGYKALAKVLGGMSPEDVISEVLKSGLRGRGGGGFPTGRKWEICRGVAGDEKYIICNADEGDPGAFMDRSILEGNPGRVIEGMTIGAFAIGAHQAYVYVRREYPLAVDNLTIMLDNLREAGLLGENIMGSGFSFDVKINRGAGAFVCGEETALLASIEGRRGMPRPRPPYPAEKGLFGKPTIINNVETWANVPVIIDRGADWFAGIGTEGSKGTKVFSLVGNVNNTGLVEVPMGITMREVVFDIGGGIPKKKTFKAVQTGGPSGGCLPESELDIPVDFDELTKAGSMMGSGGMIVMDNDTCMVEVARYFLDFLQEESCGKCTSCREGVKQMHDICERITKGEGQEGDIELLEELGQTVMETALCALGNTAPNPLLSTLRFFRHEYEAHIRDKKCPAGICKALVTYSILKDKCTGCGACVKVCPEDAIRGTKDQPHVLDAAKCIKCAACYDVCNYEAIARQ